MYAYPINEYTKKPIKPLIYSTTEGIGASFGSKKIYLKATANDTNCAFSLMEYLLDPQKCGHALHFHETFDKTIKDSKKIEAIRENFDIVDLPGDWVKEAQQKHPGLFS